MLNVALVRYTECHFDRALLEVVCMALTVGLVMAIAKALINFCLLFYKFVKLCLLILKIFHKNNVLKIWSFGQITFSILLCVFLVFYN
jgi:hypothetical protein